MYSKATTSCLHIPHTYPFVKSPTFNESYYVFFGNLSKVVEPTPYFHAKNNIHWVNVMKEELDALEANGTC